MKQAEGARWILDLSQAVVYLLTSNILPSVISPRWEAEEEEEMGQLRREWCGEVGGKKGLQWPVSWPAVGLGAKHPPDRQPLLYL